MALKEFAPYAAKRVNAFMEAYLSGLDDEVPALKESLSYGLLLGGKRFRPLLVYAAGALAGQREEVLDYAAAAVECIHAYSLIHDDMPEMDNDRLRRGHETVHVKFGQAGALLAGDALQALAFQILSDPRSGLEAPVLARLVNILAKAAGYSGMCGGQSLDLAAEQQHLGLEALKLLHSKKTGAMIRAAVMMGAQSCGEQDEAVLGCFDRFASWTGLAFQVRDDVLNVLGDTRVMGKAAGSDSALGKSTFPALMGTGQAQEFACECVRKACDALKGLKGDTSLLQEFACFAVDRDH